MHVECHCVFIPAQFYYLPIIIFLNNSSIQEAFHRRKINNLSVLMSRSRKLPNSLDENAQYEGRGWVYRVSFLF